MLPSELRHFILHSMYLTSVESSKGMNSRNMNSYFDIFHSPNCVIQFAYIKEYLMYCNRKSLLMLGNEIDLTSYRKKASNLSCDYLVVYTSHECIILGVSLEQHICFSVGLCKVNGWE